MHTEKSVSRGQRKERREVGVDDDGDASDFNFATILSLCDAQFLFPH